MQFLLIITTIILFSVRYHKLKLQFYKWLKTMLQTNSTEDVSDAVFAWVHVGVGAICKRWAQRK